MGRFKAIQFIGTQRSGSNLLRLMLNQHDQISAPHPPHLLNTFVPLLSKYGDLNFGDMKMALVDDMCRWVECNPVEWTGVHLDRINIARLSHDIFDIVEKIYLTKAHADNASIWCCKSTFNIDFTKGLENRVKPFYIYLYRDGRDVAVSFKKAIVGPKHIYHLAEKWKAEQIAVQDFLTSMDETRYISISYEDLIHEPETTLKRICTKLEIKYDIKMLHYYDSEESKHTADSGQMWSNVIKPVMSKNTNKYLTELSVEEIALFEKIASNQLLNLGYKPATSITSIENTIIDFEKFDKINAEQVERARKQAPSNDIAHRIKQQRLHKEIMERFFVA